MELKLCSGKFIIIIIIIIITTILHLDYNSECVQMVHFEACIVAK